MDITIEVRNGNSQKFSDTLVYTKTQHPKTQWFRQIVTLFWPALFDVHGIKAHTLDRTPPIGPWEITVNHSV